MKITEENFDLEFHSYCMLCENPYNKNELYYYKEIGEYICHQCKYPYVFNTDIIGQRVFPFYDKIYFTN